ncbi:hypothetical protein H744_2c2997 [Photobacterium gaetbulicola Gung47]|uniref:Uncharacterized protein n=1 Tax=Photobacterium gaetbulicola Gung47 TaxID=658445 RepID=A0A0C5WR69_9GAMM|nr:hypothetical protein H744_2c2997 [Photobacterium gaetbulicola Gung47]
MLIHAISWWILTIAHRWKILIEQNVAALLKFQVVVFIGLNFKFILLGWFFIRLIVFVDDNCVIYWKLTIIEHIIATQNRDAIVFYLLKIRDVWKPRTGFGSSLKPISIA